MRYGKIGLQLGGHQKYYISKCEEKQSIQLTITVVGSDSKSSVERKELIDDIIQLMDDIIKLFMPTVSERAAILFPCPLCTTLHITMDEVCHGNTIHCAKSSDAVVPPEYYGNLLSNYELGNLSYTTRLSKRNTSSFSKSLHVHIHLIDQHASTYDNLMIYMYFPYFSTSTIPYCK